MTDPRRDDRRRVSGELLDLHKRRARRLRRDACREFWLAIWRFLMRAH